MNASRLMIARAMADDDGPMVAEWFYEELLSKDMVDADSVAYALDVAVGKLRATGVSPLVFLRSGPGPVSGPVLGPVLRWSGPRPHQFEGPDQRSGPWSRCQWDRKTGPGPLGTKPQL
jgi:hypothetical protein